MSENLKSVVVVTGPTGPTGTYETVHIATGATGPTGTYAHWNAIGETGHGTFKHVINGGATAGRKNVIIDGYTGATGL